MVPEIRARLPRLRAWLRAEPDIATAWLAGSQARGDQRPGSDLDLAVLIASASSAAGDPLRARLRWMVAAARVLRRPLDEVDLIVLDGASPLLVQRILRDGVLLLDRDPRARIAFQERALHRYVAALLLRREAMAARAVRLATGGSR